METGQLSVDLRRRIGRLRHITGFVTTYGQKTDPRLSVFARLWHVKRVVATADRLAESSEPVVRLRTPLGKLAIVPQPEGTRGYDDLRRAATREHLGQGLRPQVASPGDLGRMLAALGREDDRDKLRALRRVAELEMGLGIRR